MKKLFELFVNRTFLTFLIIGCINTLSGVAFSYIFSLFLDANIAFVIGYVCGLIISYLLNSIFTFKESFSFVKFIRFAVSYLPNFVIQNIVVIIFYNIIGLPKIIVYLMAAIIGIPITYLIIKLFAFGKKERKF